MVDKGDVGGGLAVLASMVGAALSWAAGLGVVTILFSVGLGSLLTYLVGLKTQENAWKREANLRKVDDIYGPLYFELNKVHQDISRSSEQSYYRPFDQNQITWESIQASYKYYLIDPPLRKELDDFFALLRRYHEGNVQRSRVAEEKLLPHLRNAYGQDVQAASYRVAATQPSGMPITLPGGTLEAAILTGEHPLEFTKKQYTGFTNHQLELSIQRAGSMQPLFTVKNPNPALQSKFDELIGATIEDVKKDPRIVSLKEQRMTLIAQAESLKEKLRVKTEEPWKV